MTQEVSRGLELLRKRLAEGPDMSRFAELNDRKVSFRQRQETVRQLFPDSAPLMAPPSIECEQGWTKVFDRDPDLMGQMLKDILKADQAVPGRPGPRPGVDVIRAGPLVDTWTGKDYLDRPYSNLSFAESLTLLQGKLSITQLARKIKQPKTQTFRLLRGEIVPSRSVVEQVAAAFNKQPSWFLEYRIGTIASTLISALMASPEKSIRSFEQLYHLGVAK